MKKGLLYVLSVAFIGLSFNAEAKNYEGERKNSAANSGKSGSGNGTAANCSAPATATELDINNTRALIQTGGDMWWDLVGQPRYEIPAGSGRDALFAGSLWLGGQDVSGQLKVAAQRFRAAGNDFWTGPLNIETAEIDPNTCEEFDDHFVTTRDEVTEFVGWYEAGIFDSENGTTTQQENFPDYSIPASILNWPGNGREQNPYNEDPQLAPYFDRDGDEIYDPSAGDYPRYDLRGNPECGQRIVDIYGDKNLWWVFNDKGNIHTESNGDPIGMEVRAQAFGFATNDEVNNMTFYNYELHNRSSFTLENTYFGFWVDPDLGNAQDDYVGCDVRRGLGYCYNGDEDDEDNGGSLGYGENPPAIGVDFFQGPFQDNDGQDNPGPASNTEVLDYNTAFNQAGIPYKGLGVGYGDGIPDNERLGMRAFMYYNNGNGPVGEPGTAVDYYNYLRSFWLDNARMVYGGTGRPGSQGANTQRADFMFPGDSDPIGWGTEGNPQAIWTEVTANNQPFDRRFIQSAGPFTLAPGAVNNITVGVVWSLASSGGANASVETLRKADDKTQALFDNCFQILNGPEAPEVSVIELDKELILTLDNLPTSNNYNETYTENDPFIIPPDSAAIDGTFRALTAREKDEWSKYRFQGYQIFQLKDETVSPSELFDLDRARLVAQCDIRDNVVDLINFDFDNDLGAVVPSFKVENAANDGISKSFRITEDVFAEGDNRLVNHKTYYFMAIAYAFNEFKPYSQTNPDNLDGQTQVYLPSRKAVSGPIRTNAAIPHKSSPRDGGTRLNSAYGDGLEITRIEGVGNGGNNLEIKQEDIDEMMANGSNRILNPTYEAGAGPINVKVFDPLNVRPGTYSIAMADTSDNDRISDAFWMLYGGDLADTIFSPDTIGGQSEVLIPELGISVTISQPQMSGDRDADRLGMIDASIEYADPGNQWLGGVADNDGNNFFNWILSGTNAEEDFPEFWDLFFTYSAGDREGSAMDNDQVYETLLNGTWAPYLATASHIHGPMGLRGQSAPSSLTHQALFQGLPNTVDRNYTLSYLRDVDIVITADQSKWTRVPVVEMQGDESLAIGNARKGTLRQSPSVDKDGNPATVTTPSDNPNDPNYISATGMGWFPGYAIDLQSGERLNMSFGEDSYLISENGNDMIWNPTSTVTQGVGQGNIRFGGKHYIFVYRNNLVEEGANLFPVSYNAPENRMPLYDAGKFMHDKLADGSNDAFRDVWRTTMWTTLPVIELNQSLLASDLRVRLRTNGQYAQYGTGNTLGNGDVLQPGQQYYVQAGPLNAGDAYERGDIIEPVTPLTINAQTADLEDLVVESVNGGYPLYQFNLDALAVDNSIQTVAENALDLIGIVPNPYYAYSQYEGDKLDNRVKIINLPNKCSIKIYSMNGTLVRQFEKDDNSITSLDWDLKNQARIPIASGMYLIHIDVPGVGEKVLKWFGVMRPVDLDSF